jgi:hypothetical protein
VTTHEALEALEEAKRRALEVHGYSAIDKINEAIVILQAEEPRGAGLREDVAAEIFYMDSAFCGGKWENEPDDQKNYWREKADLILSLASPARTEGLREAVARSTDVLGDAETVLHLLAGYVEDEQDFREEIDDNEAMVEALRLAQERIKQVRKENRSLINNDIARRFSGPEGDAAAEERKLLAGRVWKCAACGDEVKGENLVILPRNTYFYHEKFSGEICGRYEEVAAHPPQQGETPKEEQR